MATNTSGITVSIQAKIEGWQAELKRIQEEAKKVNLGTEFGRELQKNIAALDKQINSMAQNLTHRLTSDTGIDNFNDKLNDVETRFKAIGDIMSSITFSDLDTSYVEPQLKSLLDKVTELQAKLNTELDTKFGDDIVKEATKVQKAFSRMGQSEEDIKKLGREGTRAALQEIVNSSVKSIDEANDKIENLRHNINQLKEAEKTWQPSKFAQENDINKYISSTVSTDASAYGLKPVINAQALEEIKLKINNAINEIKLSESKKQEIEKYLNELVPTSSVETINKRMQNIRQVLSNIPGLSAFGLDKESFSGYLKQIINETDINALDTSLNRIKERFIADGIHEEDLNKFWGSFTDSIKNQDFDKAIELVSSNLTQLQEEYKKGKEKIIQARKELEEVLKKTQSDQFKAAWTRTYGEEGLKELDELIEKAKLASSTFKELTSVEEEVKGKRQELLQPIQTVGREVSDTAIKNWYENTSAAQVYKSELDQIKSREQMLGKIEGLIQRWFSVYAVVRMVGNAIKSVINTVKELDSTITEIAIVTKMDQSDLWGQMDSYTTLAHQYASSISGVYKVSQLYYQQGLQTADVMALTEQTLKMARISGLDYAQATDYMTNAVRSFKMEMTDAQTVVDVYSAIAASSATSVTELASAMSKTASSAQAVGSSFENTTAMMAVMIEATRESAENIGSAMKSIISRYGEMTSNPASLVDSEGQEMSLNRVDKALQTVGISIHNAAGEFRNFDEVIMELAQKWDTIDTNTQRYIATIMAGNRQQSRFLALVSSYDRLKELSEEAANSENASQLQFLKTLDSVEAKTQQLQTSLQSLYTASGVEKTYKTILDLGNSIVQTFTNMETLGGFPALAITRLGTTFTSLALIVTNVFKTIKTQYSLNLKQLELLQADYLNKIKPLKQQELILEKEKNMAETEDAKKTAEEKLQIVREELAKEQQAYEEIIKRRSATKISMTKGQKVGMVASALGMAGSTWASTMDQNTQRELKGGITIASSLASAIGTFAFMGGGWTGALMAAATALSGILEGIGILTENIDEKINKLKSDIETTANAKLQSKDALQTLTDYKKKYDELSKAQYQSVEDKQAFIDLQNKIAASYPELITSMTTEGNYIIEMASNYEQLAIAKATAYSTDYLSNIEAEIAGLNDITYVLSQIYGMNLGGEHNLINSDWTSYIPFIGNIWQFINPGQNNLDLLYKRLANQEDISSIMTSSTASSIFGEGLKHLPHTGALPQFDTAKQKLSEIILEFYEAAEEGLNIQEAKDIISNKDIFAEYTSEIENFSSTIYSNLVTEVSAIKYQQILIDNYFNSALNEWLTILSSLTGIETSGFQSEVVAKRLKDAWAQYRKDAEDGIITLADGTEKEVYKIGDKVKKGEKEDTWTPVDQYKQFLESYSVGWYGIVEEETHYLQDTAIDELYKNRGMYTKSQLQSQEAFHNLKDSQQDFLDLYDEAYKDIFDRYEHFLQEDVSFIGNDELQQTLANFKDLIGPDFLQGIIDQYRKILDNTDLTQSEQASQIDTLTAAIDSLRKLSGEDQIKAFATLQTADLTSLFGIYNFIEDLNKKDINLDGTGIIEAFRLFSHTLTINLESELNSYGETISQISEDYNKDLSDATKGMDLKKASEMSKKFNISLTDFDYSNNKFFLSNLDTIKSYYLDQYQAYTDALQVEFDQQVEGYKKLEGITWNYHLKTFNWNDVFNKGFTLEELDKKFANLPDMQEHFKEQTGFEYSDFRNLYEEFLGQNETDNFFTFLETYYSDQLEIYSGYFKDLEKEAIKNAAKNALSIGNIEKFADIIFDGQEQKQNLTKFLLNAFKEGDLNNILQFVPAEYAQMIADTFKDSIKSVYDAFSLDGSIGKFITSDALNASTLASLELDGLATRLKDEEGNVVYQLATITEENIDTYIEIIKNSNLTSSVKADKLAEAHAFKYRDKVSALTTALSDQTIDYNAAQDLAEALGYTADQAEQAMADLGFVLNAATGKYHRSAQTLEKIEERIEELKGSASLEDLNELQALEDSAMAFSDSEKSQAISDVLKDYTSVTPQVLARLATAFGKSYDDIKTWIAQDNFNGTFSIDVAGIRELLQTQSLEESTRNLLNELLAGISDTYLDALKSATDYITRGTTKQVDMEKFVQDYNDKVEPEAAITIEDAFSWDDTLKTFTLDIGYFTSYREAIKTALINAGYSSNWADDYIQGLITSIDKAPNISEFLAAENKNIGSEAYNTLEKALHDQFIVNPREGYENAANYAATIIEKITQGGIEAANALKVVKPDATSEELEAAYSNAFNEYSNAADMLSEINIGSFVSGKLQNILASLNMVDANGVVNDTFNMVEAYRAIYVQMRAVSGSTTAKLNAVVGNILDNRDNQQGAIDALSNATDMTYSQFVQIFTDAGIEITEQIIDSLEAEGVIKGLGGNKMMITNFEHLANVMQSLGKWDIGSEEYINALSAYRDGIISYNNQLKDNIKGELDALKDAKVGDSINLTWLSETYGQALQEALQRIGLKDQFNNGILEIVSSADIPELLQEIGSIAANAEDLIPSELAELSDAIAAFLSDLAELISNGISGGLSNVDKYNLTEQAESRLGITDLKFTQTVDGLKLSQESAIRLYQALAKVDALQGKIVFDKLAESLKESNEHFSTTSALLAHIVDLTEKIKTADETVSQARLEQYKAELEVAKEIVAVRSAAEDESFNFMDNKIPAGQNNPLNYAKNWTRALKAINDAYKVKNTKDVNAGGVRRTASGYMGYEEFYNIVNEINNMAGIMKQPIQIGKSIEGDALTLDGTLESASNLILKGIDTLTAVDTGDMMVNIGALGINLAQGGKELKSGIKSGIDAVADAQIEALDGMIAMLELIVAMESLGDIAGEDMVIGLPDIAIDKDGDGNLDVLNDKYTEWLKKFDNIYATNEQLQTTVDGIVIDGLKWRDWLHRGAEQWSDADAQILNALYQAAVSSDWNLDDIGGSLQQLLNSGKFAEGLKGRQFTIDIGDITYTISNGVVVEVADWSTQQAQDILKQYKTKTGEKDDTQARTKIAGIIQKYLEGEGGTQDLTVTDIVKIRHGTLIKHDKKGDYIEGPDGEKYYEGSDNWYEIIQKSILKDQQGIDSKAKIGEYNVKAGTTTAEITYGQELKTHITMKATVGKDGKVTWDLGDDYKSIEGLKDYIPKKDIRTQSALLDDMYDHVTKNMPKDTQNRPIEFPTKESWIYQTFGIHLKVKTEVLKDGETVEDPTKDPKFRNLANDLTKKSAEEIKEKVSSPNKDGKIEVDIGEGYKLVLDAEDIDYDVKGEYNNDLLLSKIQESMGIDAALKDTITSSITEAFKTLPQVLSSLEASPVEKVAEAFQHINDWASSAITTITNLIDKLNELAGLKINQQPENQQPQTKNQQPQSNAKSFEKGDGPINEKGIQKYAEEVKKIETEKTIKVSADTQEAENNVNVLVNNYRQLDRPTKLIPTVEAEPIKEELKTIVEQQETIDGANPSFEIQSNGESENSVLDEVIGKLEQIDSLDPKSNIDITVKGKKDVEDAATAIGKIVSKTVDITINKTETESKSNQATGNVGLATGNAKAKGTLMGELGPELVVSNGRYFVAGQNGAEMVDLADDAIVFNHLQTKQLLKHGMSSGRGRAVTNERNAVAFATGNFEGPAMASASAALNALKQLRAMWESLRNASVSDLAGGGGGGGGGGGDKIVDPRAWIDTVERWYNLTQKIDLLEKDITHQQQLREKINSDFQKSGTAYYNSQRQSLKDLQEEIAAQEQLNISRQEYLNARVENLKKTPLGKVYSMDENGQFYWNDNTNFKVNGRNIKGGHDFLENLYGFDSQKGANYTNKQKFDILIANGFAEYMRTSANGETIKADSDNDGQVSDEEWESYYEAATEAFRDKMDEYKETTQDLADKVQEGKDEILKKQQEANELMREMRDNQIEVENNVLKAIEESRQREIDKLQDLRDAIEDSNQAYLDGLNKALENERDLYSQNESADELNRLRRQRDILARSGGSASQIAQLNDEIAQKSQDAYFEAQQQQIDALQEASDLQLERLDNQIDIMTQTLEYQKEFGLLWGDVYNVMAGNPSEIAKFLAEHTESYWAESPVQKEDTFREWLFQAEQWDSFKTDLADTKSIVANMYDLTLQQQMDKDYKTFNDQMVALHGANYDSSGKYKQAFYNEYRNSRDISKATQVAQSAYTADENAKKAAAAQARAQAQQQAAAQAQSAASGTNTVRQVGKDTTWQSNATYHYKRVWYSNGVSKWYQSGVHSFNKNGTCTVCGYHDLSQAVAKTNVMNSTQEKKIVLGDPTKAAGGGYVNHGLYELGERGIETVFTASQTKILRDNILSNRPNSLISLLHSYNENYDNISSPLNKVTTAEDNSVNIERVEMTMQVQQLANDYDARRAGEQALSEMLRIARKTSANNSIRR